MKEKVKKVSAKKVQAKVKAKRGRPKKYDEVICILDRSGSMSACWDQSIKGLNSFLFEQKKLNKPCKISFVMFDDQYELPYNRIDLEAAIDFTRETYVPRGMTALYDAIGKTISTFEPTIKSESKKISNVIVAILTDGMENASQEYTRSTVAELIERKTKEGWKFLYLGANQDAFAVSASINISNHYTRCYVGTQQLGVTGYADMSAMTFDIRSGGSADVSASNSTSK